MDRKGRQHCEALPALDIRAVARAWRRGNRRCVWLDEEGFRVGSATVLELSERNIVFDYEVVGETSAPVRPRTQEFELIKTRRNRYVKTYEIVCAACNKIVKCVYRKNDIWKCRTCHDLVYVRQRVSGVNVTLLKRDNILHQLSDPHPEKPLSSRKRRKLERQLGELRAELGTAAAASLSPELQRRTRAVWTQGAGEVSFPMRPAKIHAGAADNLGTGPTVDRNDARRALDQCSLIGIRLFHRALDRVLARHGEEIAPKVRDTWPDHMPREPRLFIGQLAPLLVPPALQLTSAWGAPKESWSDDRSPELSCSGDWTGWNGYWLTGLEPDATPVLKAILDEKRVTIRVRAPADEPCDLELALQQACDALAARISELAAACKALTAVAPRLARELAERVLPKD